MKENCTRIVIVLDRSGSMSSVRESTVAGFSEFIRVQREVGGDVRVKLVQFDDQYEVVLDEALDAVPELTQERFVPRGMTALYDAQGRTIVSLGEELSALAEDERPSKVVMMTLTDGLENASKEYTLDRVAEMIQHQRDVYGWDFVFLGANQDAVKTAGTMNIRADAAISYAATPDTMRPLFSRASNYVNRSRTVGGAAFSEEDREAAMGRGKA